MPVIDWESPISSLVKIAHTLHMYLKNVNVKVNQTKESKFMKALIVCKKKV